VRPTYETEENDLAALSIVRRGIKGIASSFAKLPRWYRVDYALVDQQGGMIGVAECKQRTKAYETVFLSMGKVMTLLDYERIGMQAWFMVSLGTVAYRIQVTAELVGRLDTRMGGRFDRGDGDDREPMVHFPLDLFTKLD